MCSVCDRLRQLEEEEDDPEAGMPDWDARNEDEKLYRA